MGPCKKSIYCESCSNNRNCHMQLVYSVMSKNDLGKCLFTTSIFNFQIEYVLLRNGTVTNIHSGIK